MSRSRGTQNETKGSGVFKTRTMKQARGKKGMKVREASGMTNKYTGIER